MSWTHEFNLSVSFKPGITVSDVQNAMQPLADYFGLDLTEDNFLDYEMAHIHLEVCNDDASQAKSLKILTEGNVDDDFFAKVQELTQALSPLLSEVSCARLEDRTASSMDEGTTRFYMGPAHDIRARVVEDAVDGMINHLQAHLDVDDEELAQMVRDRLDKSLRHEQAIAGMSDWLTTERG